jgi:CheY-like chemotaxis protein
MSTASHTRQPQALVVEDHAEEAELARFQLEIVGFEVLTVTNLRQALQQARRMLHPEQPYRRTLLLVDCKGVQPHRPDLEGPNWVAVVAQEMQQRRLHPAPIVAISGDLTEERELEARVAGCHERVLQKPLTDDDALWLRRLVMQPAVMPHAGATPEEQRMLRAFQSSSTRALHALLEYPMTWTADDAYLLLRHLTAYPEQRDDAPDDWERTEVLLRCLGGSTSARELLRNIANHLATNSVSGEILAQFLDGWQRREIVKHFVRRGLYDDSHIYNCIRDLPLRLCERLKVLPRAA